MRGYFNRGFEGVKDELRQIATADRAAAERDREGILVALDRLEEAIGFLGLQLSLLRADVDALRVERHDGSTIAKPPGNDVPTP